MIGRVAQLQRLWERLEAVPHGKAAAVVVVLFLVAAAATGEWSAMVAIVASLAIFALVSNLLRAVIDFGRRSWIGFIAIAALAWRIAAPVQRCSSGRDIVTGRWLPWQAGCHGYWDSPFTVDVGATALQVLVVAAVIVWAFWPALKRDGKRG